MSVKTFASSWSSLSSWSWSSSSSSSSWLSSMVLLLFLLLHYCCQFRRYGRHRRRGDATLSVASSIFAQQPPKEVRDRTEPVINESLEPLARTTAITPIGALNYCDLRRRPL
uniref:Uncharacterized protein n=1 Tax=Anopheles maculatus TaxID=74869 RepID=A0A182SMN3_9DIPT